MGKISRPSQVVFAGPLTPFAAGFAGWLEELGYTPASACGQLRLAAHLSRWLLAHRLEVEDLSEQVVVEFQAERRRSYTNLYSEQALRPVMDYLRRVGVAPPARAGGRAAGADGPVEDLLGRFHEYLLRERSVSAPVADAYVHWVRPFVAAMAKSDPELSLKELDSPAVARFLTGHLPGLSAKSAQITATAMRAFLRFVYLEGLVPVDLAGAVPAFAFRKGGGVPRGLTPGEVEALNGACDTSSATGRRDAAVIALMLRLGLRCQEVASLRLQDFDWAAGTVTVYGKGGREDRLPVPVDVGKAVVAYLRAGRPPTRAPEVFVRAVAPFTALGRSSVSCIVARAARRAGLGTIHAHRLRHTAASRTLNAGASLEDVALLLRHASPATTSVYAKTDQARLALLARPWPSSGAES